MTIAQRFYSQGGQLFADRRPVSLEWAREKLREWWELDRRYSNVEDYRRAREVRRQAHALYAATREAERWHRASGPNAAEAYTQRVRQMLKESLEHDRGA